jgi:transcriptional regulator with XRE-family HTH domain
MVANKPTIKDVARQAGVSIATVSRVMAKKPIPILLRLPNASGMQLPNWAIRKTARPQNWQRAPVTRLP